MENLPNPRKKTIIYQRLEIPQNKSQDMPYYLLYREAHTAANLLYSQRVSTYHVKASLLIMNSQ